MFTGPKSQRLTELCCSFGGLTELCRHFQLVVFLCNAALVQLCQTPGVHAEKSVGAETRTQEVWEKLNRSEPSLFVLRYETHLIPSDLGTPGGGAHKSPPSDWLAPQGMFTGEGGV